MKDGKKLAWANASFKDADFVIVGGPDESGSRAARQGASQGPDRIREISVQRAIYRRETGETLAQPQTPLRHRIHDLGNMEKTKLTQVIRKIVAAGKVPVTLGGDHSITYEALKGFDQLRDIRIVYLDAHPDLICSKRGYYGSVVCDLFGLKQVNDQSCILVGIRALELEETANIEKRRLKALTAFEITDWSPREIVQEIQRVVGHRHIYSR